MIAEIATLLGFPRRARLAAYEIVSFSRAMTAWPSKGIRSSEKFVNAGYFGLVSAAL
jgi:hypothetical protein